MKKTIILSLFSALSLGIVSMTFTSCNKKKDWTCTCTFSGQSVSYPIDDQKEDDAKDACSNHQINGFSCSLSKK